MAGVSYEQLTRISRLIALVQDFRPSGSELQRFYGTGLTSTPVARIQGRQGFYDIFNPTRSLPTMRAPMSGPTRISRKPAGQRAVSVCRSYEAMAIEHELVYGTRGLGNPMTMIDEKGQSYFARQTREFLRRYINLHEFMTASVFLGGWKLIPDGEDLLPVPFSDSTANAISVPSLMPSEHYTGQLAIGAGGANIIATSWDSPTADLISQFTNLNFYHTRMNGRPLRHVWGTGPVLNNLMYNTKTQAVGGSVMRIWDSRTQRELDPAKGIPNSNVNFVLRALPDITFHIYDEGYIPAKSGETIADQTSSTGYTRYIPANKVIITPDPSDDWIGVVHGGEPVKYDKGQPEKYVYGFDMGKAEEIEPPRTDIKAVNNSAVVLQENWVAYAPTVIF